MGIMLGKRVQNDPNGSGHESKHRKMVSSNGSDSDKTSEMIFNTKLIDLNVDCQEAVFQNLNLPDLLNIAASHAAFLKASGYVYSRLYKNKTVRINGNRCTSGLGHLFFRTHFHRRICFL